MRAYGLPSGRAIETKWRTFDRDRVPRANAVAPITAICARTCRQQRAGATFRFDKGKLPARVRPRAAITISPTTHRRTRNARAHPNVVKDHEGRALTYPSAPLATSILQAKFPVGEVANRASQLYSLMDIYLLGMCWALYKRRARDMEVWGWEPLQMVLGAT